jgi:hypothetical protein
LNTRSHDNVFSCNGNGSADRPLAMTMTHGTIRP